MQTLNPYDVKTAVQQTTTDDLEQDDLYQLALEVARDVQALYPFIRERPRYEALWDQAQRASSSVVLNYCQGVGKLRGFMQNDFLCSRAEGYELFAALAILPKDQAEPIKAKLKTLLKMLDARILAIPEKPQWRG